MNGFKISMRLITLVKEMIPVMVCAIILGILGFFTAIFIPVLGVYGIANIIDPNTYNIFSLSQIVITIIIIAIMRGILRYGEQASNHYIAFRVLAIIRDIVFKKLRTLAPAKLEGRGSGDLVAMITSDVELLEVFYAHTISPVMIAIITNTIITILLMMINPYIGLIGLVSYVIIGVIIPIYITSLGNEVGDEYRENSSALTEQLLDGLYGLDELIQFNYGEQYKSNILDGTTRLNDSQEKMRSVEGWQVAITNGTILVTGLIAVFSIYYLTNNGIITSLDGLIGFTLLMSSFGPVVALSNLANNLLITFASARRVLNLLDEDILVKEIVNGSESVTGDVVVENVSFKYLDETILNNISLNVTDGSIVGIKGPSGCGKSTLIKLLMRFYETVSGEVKYDSININEINTSSLRNSIGFVSQESFLLNDTIRENLKIANLNATEVEMMQALKAAAILDFVKSLPQGLDTVLGENGSNLSGGERQRIGLARALLSNSKYIYLDEPTANLDVLNEKIILNSLSQIKGKTIILVSHRSSTLSICKHVIDMEAING